MKNLSALSLFVMGSKAANQSFHGSSEFGQVEYGHALQNYDGVPSHAKPQNYHNEQSDCDVEKWKKVKHLDTPDYQALSAWCKQQLIWERVNRDYTPEKFYTGDEF